VCVHFGGGEGLSLGCIYMCVQLCLCVCLLMCVCGRVLGCVCACTRVSTCMHELYSHLRTEQSIFTFKHCAHSYIHIRVSSHLCCCAGLSSTELHTHTYTHTHRCSLPARSGVGCKGPPPLAGDLSYPYSPTAAPEDGAPATVM